MLVKWNRMRETKSEPYGRFRYWLARALANETTSDQEEPVGHRFVHKQYSDSNAKVNTNSPFPIVFLESVLCYPK